MLLVHFFHILATALILAGPWHFHPGDDASWSNPAFDDAGWATLDLHAPAGAHDGDVGLSGYVPGWSAHGYSTRAGYAWYRTIVRVDPSMHLAIAGPPDVDDAYQLYANGRLLGGAGDFHTDPPTLYSVQPRYFPLSPELVRGGVIAIAIRTWMSPDDLGDPEAGCIHIAPIIGDSPSVVDRYRWEWIETIRGYAVEVVEACAFTALAVMACSILPLEPHNRAYLWLAAGLMATGLVRLNQAIFYWFQIETVSVYLALVAGVLVPAGLLLWANAWWRWFDLPRRHWVLRATLGLFALDVIANETGHATFDSCVRLAFVAIAVWTAVL